MLRYTLRRLILTIPVVIGLSIVVFAYVRLIPGDPVSAMLAEQTNPELVAELNQRYGFDRPILEQYGIWVQNLVRGDLGVSFRSRQDVAPLIAARIPVTLQLSVGGLIVALGIAFPLGVLAGMHYRGRTDNIISTITLVGLGAPGFLLATILAILLAVVLRLLPPQGYVPFFVDPINSIRLSLLPWISIGVTASFYLTRVIRTLVIEVMKEPFVPYADARGLRERAIFWRYVIRNVLPPFTAVLGVLVGGLLAGSVAIELLFVIPGMGRTFIAAVGDRDYAMVQALILIYGLIFVVVNLVSELAHGLLDPRVRLE